MSAVIITLSQGKRIRYAREVVGLEQDDIARAARVARSTVSAWENDRNKKPVPYAFLLIVANLTGMPVEFFEGEAASFASIPDGGSPLAMAGAGVDTGVVTGGYRPTTRSTDLRLAA